MAQDLQQQKVLDFLKRKALQEPCIFSLILFGSRARGDSHLRSDYDVAVLAPDWNHEAWSKWALEVREEFPSLVGIDLVWIQPQISKELSQKIQSEGKEIYVKPT